jgi:hypothetical protein
MRFIWLQSAVRSFVLLALALVPLLALGQVTKGSISGTVVDPAGAVVVSAQVKAIDTQTGNVLETVSDKSGYFRFSLINPSLYKVEIKKSGFTPKVINNVAVGTSQDSGLGSIQLTLAGVQATVEVSDTYTPLIETTQAQVTTSFDPIALTEISGIGENEGLDNLALQVPGVNASRGTGYSNSNGLDFTVNGIRGRNNDQQIDGQNNNDNSVGGPSIQISNAEFVGEYQIITNNFGAEYGRNAGSVVNVVIKSGTNKVHGSMYGTDNNSDFNTLTSEQKRFQHLTKVPRSNVEFAGFTLGGPVVKNKLFFFEGFDEEIAHYQNSLHTDALTPTLAGLATIAGCSGISANAVNAIQKYSPYAFTQGNPTATNVATGSLTIGSSTCTGVAMGGVTRVMPENQHEFDWVTRVDYQHSKDSVTMRYAYDRNNWFNIPDSGAAGWFYNEPALGQAVKLGWTRQLSSKIVNELSGSFSRNNVQFGGSSNGSDPTMGNLKQAVTHVAISKTTFNGSSQSSLGYGTATNLPQGRVVNTWQIQDNFNYQLGNHHLKAGVNWTYQRSPNTFLPNVNGSFSYASWGKYLADAPSSTSIANGDPTLDFREYDTFSYVGDDWKVKPNLTVNIGLTWSLYGQPANLFHTKDMKIQTGSNPLWLTTLPTSVTTFPILPTDYSSVGPSAGFAWSPKFLAWHGETVVRGGYRLSYDPPFYNIYLNISSSAPQVFSQTISSLSGKLPADPIGPNVRSALASYLTLGTYDPRTFNETNVASDFKTDMVHGWSLGIQHELGKDAALEVRYVGNHGARLFQSINENPYIKALAASWPGQIPSGTTVASNGRIISTNTNMRERTNTGYSDYHGVQTQFRAKDLYHQLTVNASYTFSKTTDNASEIFGNLAGGATTAFSQNPLNYKGEEHALSGLDTPNNFTLSLVEQIPYNKNQHGVAGHVLGGWGISANYYLAAGQPYTPIQYYFDYYSGYTHVSDYSFNAAFAGTYDNLRPFLGSRSAPATAVGVYAGDACPYIGTTAICALSSTQLISFNSANQAGTAVTTTKDKVRYIMNSYYAQQVNGTPWGTAGRNAGRDYWTNRADATFFKNLKLRDNMKAQVRATFSNLFNHPNYDSIDPILEDTGDNADYDGFGDPKLTSGGARTVTLGATIRF